MDSIGEIQSLYLLLSNKLEKQHPAVFKQVKLDLFELGNAIAFEKARRDSANPD